MSNVTRVLRALRHDRPFTAEQQDGLYRGGAEYRHKVLVQLVRLVRHGFVLAREVPALPEGHRPDIVD